MPSRWIAAALAGLALTGAAPAPDAPAAKPAVPQVAGGTVVSWPDLTSAHLGQVPRVWVWLPPQYARDPKARYPVLYMHDGHNLFDRRLSNFDKEWQVDEAILRMTARGDLRPWIVVGIEAPKERYRTLFPQRLLAHLPPAIADKVFDTELADGNTSRELAGDAYLQFLVKELKPRVDRTFRTLAGPRDTAVMGSSMGGLISLYAIAEYPEVFGQAAGLSTHLPLVMPDKADPAERPAQVAAAFAAYFKQTKLDPRRNRIYIDHGTGTLDAYYPPYAAAFDTMMASLGWKPGPAYESRAFFAAEHEENAWAQRIDIPLAFLDQADP